MFVAISFSNENCPVIKNGFYMIIVTFSISSVATSGNLQYYSDDKCYGTENKERKRLIN